MNAWLDVMMVPQVRPFSGEAVARVGSSKPSPYVAPGEAASIMARAPQGALTHRPNRYVQSSPWKTVTTSALTLDFRVESIDTLAVNSSRRGAWSAVRALYCTVRS